VFVGHFADSLTAELVEKVTDAGPAAWTRPAGALSLAGMSSRRASPDDRPWHHTGRGFRNPPGSPHRTARQGDYWRFVWRRILTAQRRPAIPEGHCLDRDDACALLAAHDAGDSLTWLGHAAFLLRLAGVNILFDPYLGDYASPVRGLGPKRFVNPGLRADDLPPIDLIVVSHNHYDHLCAETIAALRPRLRGAAVVPLGLGDFLARRGYDRVHELDWRQTLVHGPVKITALPAIHWSKRTPFDRNRSLWASFAVEGAGRRVWFAGDTGYGPVFEEIGRTHGPFDLAMLPIGAYEPRSIMETHHTTPEEAVRIARDIGARHLVAMHWGTIILTDEHPFEPPRRFAEAASAAGFAAECAWLMKIGETRALPAAAGWPLNAP